MKGKHIKIWLIEHDMKSKDLAPLLGVTPRTLSAWTTSNGPKWLNLALETIAQNRSNTL